MNDENFNQGNDVEMIPSDSNPVESVSEGDNSEHEAEEEAPTQLIDPDERITQDTIKETGKMIRAVGEHVQVMQSIWDDTRKEFGLKDEHLKEIYAWNNNHADPEPEDFPEDQEWDKYNGIDKLTDEDIVRIFGEEHPIIGVDTQQTIDRIKSAFKEFIECLNALREYRQVNDAYAVLLDMFDEQNIQDLQDVCDAETDPDKKRIQQAAIDVYRSNKNLGFLKEPLDDASITRIISAFTKWDKCNYWMKRSIDKLKQLKISTKFLEEIWRFESRYLDEKYHKMNNMLLLYFMHLIVFCDCKDDSKDNRRRTYVIFMFAALDSFIKNQMSPERKDKIKENVSAMLDQLIDKIPEGVETINEVKNPL